MLFVTILRHALTRFIAVFIVILVVSPYSEPFATMSGTDFGGAGAVDVGGGGAKFKTTTDALVAPPFALVFAPIAFVDRTSTAAAVMHDSRPQGRAVLRL